MLPRASRFFHTALVTALALFIVATTAQTAAARAQQPAQASTCNPDAPGTIVEEIPLLNHRAAFPVEAHKNVLIAVELPTKITGITIPRPMARKFYFQRYGDELSGFEFKPRTAPTGSVTSITLQSGRDRVTMRVKVAKQSDDVKCLMYRVAPYSLIAYWKQKLRPYIDGLLDAQHKRDVAAFETQRRKEREEVERRERERAAKADLAVRVAVARQVLRQQTNGKEHTLRPIPSLRVARSSAAQIYLGEPAWHDGEMMIPFELANSIRRSILLTGVKVTNSVGFTFQSEILYIESPGQKPKHAVAEIPGRQRVRGVFSLRAASDRSTAPLYIEFLTIGATPPIAAVQQWYPMDKEVIERGERARQVAVSARVLSGGFWMDDAIDGTGAIDGTMLTGIGVHINKGLSNLWAFEAEVVAGRTGQAHFASTTWNNLQGDLTRQATFGRLRGSGILRFGDQQIVSVRAGLGIQFAVHESTFDSGGMSTTGPGDGFVVDGVWTVGAGYEARLGKSWSVGIDGTFDKLVSSDARMLEVALRFGYRWTP